MAVSVMREKYRALLQACSREIDLMWRAVRRVREGLLEEMTVICVQRWVRTN